MEPKPAAPAQPTETAEQQIAEPVTERVMQQLSEEEEVDVPKYRLAPKATTPEWSRLSILGPEDQSTPNIPR